MHLCCTSSCLHHCSLYYNVIVIFLHLWYLFYCTFLPQSSQLSASHMRVVCCSVPPSRQCARVCITLVYLQCASVQTCARVCNIYVRLQFACVPAARICNICVCLQFAFVREVCEYFRYICVSALNLCPRTPAGVGHALVCLSQCTLLPLS